jgi:putative ABC transport system permease protein
MMRKDVDGHFDLLLAALLFVAILMGLVAVIALGSAMGSNIAERTREIGVMRAIGATPGKVRRIILCEGVAAGLMSVPLAVALSLPLSLGLGHFLGEMLFGLGFPLAVSLPAIAGWSGLAFAGSLAATGAPAYRATRLSVHQAISTV